MPAHRSIPQCTAIPELAYPDLGEAVDWPCAAFGFTLRLRIANDGAQLNVRDRAVVLTEQRGRGQDSPGAVFVSAEPRRPLAFRVGAST
jgi:hypothetical protein